MNIRALDNRNSHVDYEVAKLFGYLQKHVSSDHVSRLIAQEWRFFQSINVHSGDNEPRLKFYDEMRADPVHFVALIQQVVIPDKYSSAVEVPETERNVPRLGQQADEILECWQNVPGQTTNHFDTEHFKTWYRKAEETLQASGYSRAARYGLSRVFARTPRSSDDTWPHEDLLPFAEQILDADMIGRVSRARYNGRRVRLRSGSADGTSDHQKANRYKAWAKNVEILYPKTARMLREVARYHDETGNRFDRDAFDILY